MSAVDLGEFALALHARDEARVRVLDTAARAQLARFCAGYLADADAVEDVVQEALASLAAAPELPRAPRAWLLRVVRNACLDRVRERAARPDGARLATSFDAAGETAGPVSRSIGAEQQGEVGAALAGLGADERELLRLRYADDLTRAEIAEVLGIDETLVKSRLYEAIETLRSRLGAEESSRAAGGRTQ